MAYTQLDMLSSYTNTTTTTWKRPKWAIINVHLHIIHNTMMVNRSCILVYERTFDQQYEMAATKNDYNNIIHI